MNSGKEILVAVHYTNIDDMKKLDTLLTGLQVKEIDYDIVGLSFYPYWHGTMDDLKNAIIHIRDTYGKKVYVAENAYCYTSEDGDGSANSIKGTDDLAEGYFEADAYSDELKNSLNRYEELCFRKDLTEDERAERAEIRIRFKNISSELSGAAKERFEDIERRRKAHD